MEGGKGRRDRTGAGHVLRDQSVDAFVDYTLAPSRGKQGGGDGASVVTAASPLLFLAPLLPHSRTEKTVILRLFCNSCSSPTLAAASPAAYRETDPAVENGAPRAPNGDRLGDADSSDDEPDSEDEGSSAAREKERLRVLEAAGLLVKAPETSETPKRRRRPPPARPQRRPGSSVAPAAARESRPAADEEEDEDEEARPEDREERMEDAYDVSMPQILLAMVR